MMPIHGGAQGLTHALPGPGKTQRVRPLLWIWQNPPCPHGCPTYREENIHPIIEKLYQGGFRERANDICNEYARKESPDLLRDLYDRYNS